MQQAIAKKLLSIMTELKSVEKAGENKFHKYNYVKEDDVASAVRAQLIKHKLYVSVSQQSVVHEGGLTTVCVNYTFIDCESDATHTVTAYGTGSDQQDKGLYKALTGCNKYFWLRTLQLSSGDDPEEDADFSQLPQTVAAMPTKSVFTRLSNDPGSFIIPYGRDKGKKVSALSPEQAHESLVYWKDRVLADGKPPSSGVKQLIEALTEYLKTVGDANEDIPQ